MTSTSDWMWADPDRELPEVLVEELPASTQPPRIPNSRGPTRFERLGLQRPRGAASTCREATGVHGTIVAVDVAGFGEFGRNNASQLRIRRGLYGAMRYAFETANIPWEDCRREDRGDGVLIIAPAHVPKSFFADRLPGALAAALGRHNRAHPAVEQIRLRLALHAGEIHTDEHGVTSVAINHTFRILDAAAVKSALADSDAVLAVVSSGWFFDDVVRQSDLSQHDGYSAVEIVNKETITQAWLRLVGDRRRPRFLR